MAVFVRIRAWRARRKDRKNEQLIALAGNSPKDAKTKAVLDANAAALENVDARLGSTKGP
jgi:hypothetical protein